MLCQALLRARQAIGNRFAPQGGRFHHRSITTPGTGIYALATIFTIIPSKKHTMLPSHDLGKWYKIEDKATFLANLFLILFNLFV